MDVVISFIGILLVTFGLVAGLFYLYFQAGTPLPGGGCQGGVCSIEEDNEDDTDVKKQCCGDKIKTNV